LLLQWQAAFSPSDVKSKTGSMTTPRNRASLADVLSGSSAAENRRGSVRMAGWNARYIGRSLT
jgi:hypothetical protein